MTLALTIGKPRVFSTGSITQRLDPANSVIGAGGKQEPGNQEGSSQAA
ncbi:hypothetical protein [Asaia sp. As-1742]|nr:hypothetical protein [Asaia sp. As-1742]